MNGITAGQVPFWGYHRRSGKPRNRTRRTDRLIRLSAERLFESGGFELMKEAYALFAGERPRMARNLERVWDGVGTWGG
jgi:hypothetical protein